MYLHQFNAQLFQPRLGQELNPSKAWGWNEIIFKVLPNPVHSLILSPEQSALFQSVLRRLALKV